MYKWIHHIKLHKRVFLPLIALMLLGSVGTSLPFSALGKANHIWLGEIPEGEKVILAFGIITFALFMVFAILFWRGVFTRHNRPWIGALFQTVLIYIAGAALGGTAIGGSFEALRKTGVISYESGMIGIELCSAFIQGITRVLVIYFALSRLYQIQMNQFRSVFWKTALIVALFSLVGSLIGLFLSGPALWIYSFLWDVLSVMFAIVWLDITMRGYKG